MPCVKIWTNLPKTKIPGDFVEKIIKTLSMALKKPEEKFVCVLTSEASVHMFGDAQSPGAIASIESIGSLAPEENINTAKEVTDIVFQELGIAANRFFISFYDLKPQDVAVSGNTIAGTPKA